ncbi:MAG: ATP-grasp domain-containing protein [Gemmatimonadales bacterium]
MRVLIAGMSARALAESAARVGYEVAAVDAFGDLDLEARAPRTIALRRSGKGGVRFNARAAVRAARGIACDAVAYTAGFENHPRAVAALAGARALWGNPPTVLARVRDPLRLARALRKRGFATLAVRVTRASPASRNRWLLKPRASGGGHAILPWRHQGERRVPPAMYLQERITGVPGSIVFAADGRRAVTLGLSLALAGERAFGARSFGYCGNILAGAGDAQFADDARLFAAATALAAAVTEEFGLVGVNGIDFIARRGIPYALEVNPRYTASMELVERAYGLSMFEIHARACAGALLPFDLASARAAPGAIGKAIVYARRTLTLGDTGSWLADDSVRDVPQPHERIARGRPVCTIFARGRDGADCYAALGARAVALYGLIEPRARRIA